MATWTEAEIQRYIDDADEEGLTLDYKASGALAKSDGKKFEITKDVSAMTNSAGGIIIYGLKEHPTQKHIAEKIDPIDRTQFSKEWLEHVISNIRPRLSGVVIHPISLASGANDVAYVVEIPQSETAHQATDKRYYKRFNFESVAMEDFEIRDTMNRATMPDAAVEFSYTKQIYSGNEHHYGLTVKLKNLGKLVINNFQLQFTFPQYEDNVRHLAYKRENVDFWQRSINEWVFTYRSRMVLFPQEERDIGRELGIQYAITGHIYAQMPDELFVNWKLNADNMPTKTGSLPFSEVNCF